MRTPFDPRPLDPAPDPAHRAESQDSVPQAIVGPGGQPESTPPSPVETNPAVPADISHDPTPAATVAVVEAAMLVVDAAGIVEVGARADAASMVETPGPSTGSVAPRTAPEDTGDRPQGTVPTADSAVPDRVASHPHGRTLVKVAQFAATAAALAFLAFGGTVPDVVATAKAYFPHTRLAELLRIPSSVKRSARPQASPPRPAPAAVPAVSRPNAPAPAQTPAPAKSPKVAAPSPARAPQAAPVRKSEQRSASRRGAQPLGAERPGDEAPNLPAGMKEQQRQDYYLRLMGEGHRLYQSGWFGPAMGRFRQGAAVKPQSQNAHLWIARSAMRTGRYDVARAAAERAIAIAPNNDAAREARALLDQLKVVERERL